MKKNISIRSLAIAFLARRELTRLELEKKLLHHFSRDFAFLEINKILDELEKDGYINDERFADTALHLWENKYGCVRIIAQLKNKGVSQKLRDRVREKLEPTEVERAKRLWEEKFGQLDKISSSFSNNDKNEFSLTKLKNYGKQVRFLTGRGFSMEVIRSVLRSTKFDVMDT